MQICAILFKVMVLCISNLQSDSYQSPWSGNLEECIVCIKHKPARRDWDGLCNADGAFTL